jgi:hypothetical protein
MNDPRARKLYESRDRYENAQAERKEFINMMAEKLKRDSKSVESHRDERQYRRRLRSVQRGESGSDYTYAELHEMNKYDTAIHKSKGEIIIKGEGYGLKIPKKKPERKRSRK